MKLQEKYVRRFESKIIESLFKDLSHKSKSELIHISTEHLAIADKHADGGQAVERFIANTISGCAAAILQVEHNHTIEPAQTLAE